jgi:hypothetical protein
MAATTFSLFGKDTITIGGRLITDFGAGEIGKLSFATDIATVKTGKDANSIYIKNESGNQASLELKVIRGSGDDAFLNGKITNYKTDPTTFVLITAVLVKPFGIGIAGAALKSDTYQCEGGIPTKQVEVVFNVEGDSEQAISVYTFIFAYASRTIS